MPEGTIKRLTDRGFGFIDIGNNNDIFFHMSGLVDGAVYEDLFEGQKVTYEAEDGPKGPRGVNVTPVAS